jgi:hypothetical protein
VAIEAELQALDTVLAELEVKLLLLDDGVVGGRVVLTGRDAATLARVRTEAKMLLDEELGAANDFSMKLMFATSSSITTVHECRGMIQGALNHLKRQTGVRKPGLTPSKPAFVDASRLAALRAIKSPAWDLTRLIRLCEELNTAHANECFMSMAMLGRAILDHVPPLFGKKTFAEVASNYSGPSSFKGSMQSLQTSLRHIADSHLHIPIRSKETLPTGTQVDFHKDLDVLLGEIVRTLR